MDLNEIWQDHKTFILGLTGSVLVFFVAKGCIVDAQKDAAARQRNSLRSAVRKVSNPSSDKPVPPGQTEAPKGLFDENTKTILRREARLERESYEALWRACAFQRRERWPYRDGIGFAIPESGQPPAFICDEAASALDQFWSRNLATSWIGKRFTAHRGAFPMTGDTKDGTLSLPERFLLALDLTDRVFNLAAHHRMTEIEVSKVHSREALKGSRRAGEEENLLRAEVAVELVFRAPSLNMRLFMQDLLVNQGEGLSRNAAGEDRVSIEGLPDGARAFFKREGAPWPVQVEEARITPEFSEDSSQQSLVRAEFTLVARVLREIEREAEEE